MSDCTLRKERSDLDRPAGHRHRQRLHPGGATKAHRRIVDHSPAGGIDLHRPPGCVAKVEVEPLVQSADADMDDAFRRIEMRLGLDHVQRRLQRLRTRRALRRLEEAARQPAAKALGADRPGLPVAVDVEVGEAGSVRARGTARRSARDRSGCRPASGRARQHRHFPRRWPHRAPSPGSPHSSAERAVPRTRRGRLSSAPQAAPALRA